MITKLIDEIRSTLVQSIADTDLVGEIAHEYSEAVVQCNARLRETLALIDQGHVTEALYEADKAPQLLEMVGILEFPERADWIDLCRSLCIDPPPELRLDLADRLDEAYAINMNIEGLMRKMRLLALARGPLASRIAIQRLLCQRDEQNLVWRRDLAALEKARLKEIEVAIVDAGKKRSFPEIEALRNELGATWTVPVPQELVSRVDSTFADLQELQRREQADRAGISLRDAFISYDERLGMRALAAWRSAVEPLGLTESDSLVAQYWDALAWIEEVEAQQQEQAGYNAALASLQRVMDQGRSLAELDRAEYRAKQFGHPLPKVTAERLQAYRSNLEWRRKVRLLGVTISIVILALGFIAITWYTVKQMQRGEAALYAAVQIEEMLGAGKLRAAQQMVESLDTTIASHPRVAPWIVRLEEAVTADNFRVQQRATALDAARAAGLNSPDSDMLEQALSLSISDAERAEISELMLQVERRQNELRSERENRFREERTEFERRIRGLLDEPQNAQKLQGLVVLRGEIETWRTAAGGFINGVPRVAAAERQRAQPLIDQINNEITTIGLVLEQEQSIKQATNAVGDPEEFVNRLKELQNHISDPTVVRELETTIEEIEFTRAYVKWKQFLSDSAWTNYPEWEDAQRKEFRTRAQTLADTHPIQSLVEPVNKVTAYTENMTRQANIDPKRHFDRRWFVGIRLMQDSKGRLYHCTSEPAQKGNEIELQFYLDDKFLIGQRRIPIGAISDLGLAPQCQLFQKIEPILEAHGEKRLSTWKTTLLLIVEVLTYAPEASQGNSINLDPILRGRLLRDLMRDAEQLAPEFVFLELSHYKEAINHLNNDLNEDWLDSSDRDAETARENISRVLDSTTEVLSIRSAIDQIEDMPAPPMLPTCDYRWAGWISRNTEGEYEVRSITPLIDGNLWCLIDVGHVDGKRLIDFVSVGDVKNEVQNLQNSALIFGRPIYQKVEQ